MTDTIRRTPDGLEFISRLSPITRLLLGIFGLVPLLAPYELLIRPSWPENPGVALVFPLVISLGAVAVAGFLWMAALAGRSRHLEIDASRRVAVYRFSSVLRPAGREVFGFDDIESLRRTVSEWEGGPDTYGVGITFRGRAEIRFGDLATPQEADRHLAVLKGMTGA